MNVGGKEKVIKGNERVDIFARAHIPTSLDDSIPELDKKIKKIIDKVKKVKIECGSRSMLSRAEENV